MMSDDVEHRNGARETVGIASPLIEKLVGKWTDANVLYLDLLGTIGRLDEARKVNRLRERQEVALTQTSFVSALARDAQRFPVVRVEQLSDTAFAVCDDLETLFLFAMNVLVDLTVYAHVYKRIPVPARGAISRGIAEFHSDAASLAAIVNLCHSNFIGYGMADAYRIERAGPKGMRLFAAESLVPGFPQWLRHRTAGGPKVGNADSFVEVNWMVFEDGGRHLREYPIAESALREIANDWGGRAELQRSLNDLVSWV